MKYTAYITIKGKTQTKGFKISDEALNEDEFLRNIRSKIKIRIEKQELDIPDFFNNLFK